MHKITDLSFVKKDGVEICVWCPEVVGDYEKDCARGRECAVELVGFMQATENPTVLAHIVNAMPAKTGAVETGFLTMLALCAMEVVLPIAYEPPRSLKTK